MKLLAALLTAAVAAPPTAVPIAIPAGKWVVEFDDNYCLASRSFTVGDKQLAFGLQPRPTSKRARAFIQAPRKLKSWDWEKAEVYIGSARLKVEPLLVEPVVKPGHARYVVHLDEEQLQKLTESDSFTIDGKQVRVRFPMDELPRVRKVLDDCMIGLLEAWGLSRDAQASLATFPEGDLSSVFSGDDYPAKAIGRGAIGYVDVVLTVAADGRVTNCRFARSSGHKELDEITCQKLRKGSRFEPARDRNGRAVVSPYFTSVSWVMQ